MDDLVALSNGKKFPRRISDAARRLRDLEAQFRVAQDPLERALIADALVPEYVSRGDANNAAEILASVPVQLEGDLKARLAALCGVVDAMLGADPDSKLHEALDLLPVLDERSVGVVRSRAGIAYFFARRAREAEEQLLQALWISDATGQRLTAARTASVLYGVHYHLTGDLEAARYYAEVMGVEAVAAGEPSLRRLSLLMQYDLAASFAEWDRVASLRSLLRREINADVYGNEVAARFSDALTHGTSGDFSLMRATTEIVLGQANETADFALAHALRAVALAGLGMDDEARTEARHALALGREPQGVTERTYLTIRRRLAAVLGAHVCILIGDVVRGSRALGVRAKSPGSIGAFAAALLRNSLRGAAIDLGDPALRTVKGYASLALMALSARTARELSVTESVRTLTDTELVILRSAAQGMSNSEIARQRGVSRNAVERRLMSAYGKLGVRSRAEAIAKMEVAKSQ